MSHASPLRVDLETPAMTAAVIRVERLMDDLEPLLRAQSEEVRGDVAEQMVRLILERLLDEGFNAARLGAGLHDLAEEISRQAAVRNSTAFS